MSPSTPRQLVVVEDDLIVRTLLTKRLRAAGYAVESAPDGRAGLDLLIQVRPELVLTDWMMPEMDGPQLIAALRADARLRRTYVILLTSKDDRADRVSGLDMGADDYLVKPWSEDELLAHVRSGLRIQTLQQELAAAEHKSALLTMAATLGHEINNPLTVLSAAVQIARQQRPTGDALSEFLDRCVRQTERIGQVVKCLESLSDPQTTTYVGSRQMLDFGGWEPSPADSAVKERTPPVHSKEGSCAC